MNRIVFKHKKFSVQIEDVKMPDGYSVQFASIVKEHGTAIIAFVDKETILLNRQYRPAVKKWIYELPGGKIEKGESPKENAIKELEEETGYFPNKTKLISKLFPAPYLSNDIQYLFLATDLVKRKKKLEKGEVLSTKKVKISDAVNMIKKGKIKDAVTIAAVLMIKVVHPKHSSSQK